MTLSPSAGGDMKAVPGESAQADIGVVLDECGAVLFLAAQSATTAQLALAVRHSSGLIHAAMYGPHLDLLRIPVQPVFADQDSGLGFTVAVDAASVGTGISAIDRALTLRTLADPETAPGDLRRPGHVLPVRCRPDADPTTMTVWERALQIVACQAYIPVAGACRLVHDDGEMLNANAARKFADEHGLQVYG